MLKEYWSPIPPISTNGTTTFRLKQLNTKETTACFVFLHLSSFSLSLVMYYIQIDR